MALMRKDNDGLRRIDGEGVYLRAPELRDYQDWADLRLVRTPGTAIGIRELVLRKL